MKLNLNNDTPLCKYCGEMIEKYHINYYFDCASCGQSGVDIQNNNNYYCYLCDKPCLHKSNKINSELYDCKNCLRNKYYVAYECSEYYDIRRIHIKDEKVQSYGEKLYFLDIFHNKNYSVILSYENNITEFVKDFNYIISVTDTIKNKKSISAKLKTILLFL